MNENIFLVLIVCLFYIIGLFIIYRRFSVKRIEYIVENHQLLPDELIKIDGACLSFDGQNLQNATVSIVELANISLKKIRATDVVNDIVLIIDDAGSYLIHENANEFVVSKQRNSTIVLESLDEYSIKVGFNTLMMFERIRLALLHTGELKIKGVIKDGILQRANADGGDSFDYVYFSSFLLFGFFTLIVTTLVASNLYEMGIVVGLYVAIVPLFVITIGLAYITYQHWKNIKLNKL